MPAAPRVPTALVALVATVATVATVAALGGCSRTVGPVPLAPPESPPDRGDLPTPPPASGNRPRPSGSAAGAASATPSAFPDGVAVPCAGRPAAGPILAVLRRVPNLVPANAPVTVKSGPLCAGTWQYVVIGLPEREPLQVLTRGSADALTFVTAGTNVCNVEVRATAPAGILAIARC